MKKFRIGFAFIALVANGLAACSTVPDNPENVCDIFEERGGWYKAAAKSEKRWGAPVSLQMAILKVESGFDDDAKPKRKRFLGLVPLGRPSSAEGYAQAVDGTWEAYKRSSGNGNADRNHFADAADFVGWYVNKTSRELGLSKSDAYRQYLAYHVGQAGYRRGAHRSNKTAQTAARRTQSQEATYARQLRRCRDDLEDGFLFFLRASDKQSPPSFGGCYSAGDDLTFASARAPKSGHQAL